MQELDSDNDGGVGLDEWHRFLRTHKRTIYTNAITDSPQDEVHLTVPASHQGASGCLVLSHQCRVYAGNKQGGTNAYVSLQPARMALKSCARVCIRFWGLWMGMQSNREYWPLSPPNPIEYGRRGPFRNQTRALMPSSRR